jgi:hypothetical protein
MDTRNGDLYPSKELALAAGVPEEHIVEVEPEIVRVTNGPFKGRRYRRDPVTRNLIRLPDRKGRHAAP